MQKPTIFLASAVTSHILPNMRVLDLGAGTGKHARMFRDSGALVVAVEPMKREGGREKNIEWKEMKVEQFIEECAEDAVFDLIFIQNLLHFLPKDWVLSALLPWVNCHTAPGGLVAIRTFTQSPVPAYKEELSYYTPSEFRKAFLGWEKVVSETMESFVNGHHFFLLDRAARKPISEQN